MGLKVQLNRWVVSIQEKVENLISYVEQKTCKEICGKLQRSVKQKRI